jgi:hypothetical protein
MSQVLARSWSIAIVVAILGLPLLGLLPSEPGRAFASILCLALLVQSWFAQRRYFSDSRKLVLLTLVLSLPALASTWLGLNVIRFYSYPGDEESKVYSEVIRLQSGIEWFAVAVALVTGLWLVYELAHWLAARLSPNAG